LSVIQELHIKKLKYQINFLDLELKETQMVADAALEKFNKDFSIADNPKPRPPETVKPKKIKDPELSKLYKRIANKTHPDKLINKDLSVDEKTKLENLYKKASEASSNNDADNLLRVADQLGFDDIFESEFYLKKQVEELISKIQNLKTTYSWMWYHTNKVDRPALYEHIKGILI